MVVPGFPKAKYVSSVGNFFNTPVIQVDPESWNFDKNLFDVFF